MIGCDCRVCRSDDPRDRRSRASIYVETPETALVVDTGPDFRMQACAKSPPGWMRWSYTHSHTDHIMGFDDLRPFCPVGAAAGLRVGDDDARSRARLHLRIQWGKSLAGLHAPVPHMIVSEPFNSARRC